MTQERLLNCRDHEVRALLAGTKTQMRRVVKLPHSNPLGQWEPTTFGGPNGGRTAKGDAVAEQGAIWHTRTGECICSPYGQSGDQLWVREAFAFTDAHMPRYEGSIEYKADNKCLAVSCNELIDVPHRCDPRPFEGPWKPSIHMPRWSSRITLEITGVRVERLGDITKEDASAEGVGTKRVSENDSRWIDYTDKDRARTFGDPRFSFWSLWESINGKESRDANPWVWAIDFKVVKP